MPVGKTGMAPDHEGLKMLGIAPDSIIGVHVSECGVEPYERVDRLHPTQRQRPRYDSYLCEKGFDPDNQRGYASFRRARFGSHWLLAFLTTLFIAANPAVGYTSSTIAQGFNAPRTEARFIGASRRDISRHGGRGKRGQVATPAHNELLIRARRRIEQFGKANFDPNVLPEAAGCLEVVKHVARYCEVRRDGDLEFEMAPQEIISTDRQIRLC